MKFAALFRSPTTIAIGIGAVGGAVASMSLPPFGFWPVGILGFAILLFAMEDHSILQRSLAGFAFGLGVFVPGLWWAQHFNWYGALVLMVLEALFFALAGALTVPGRGRTYSAIGAFVLAEYLRESWPLGGLPIGGLPLGQTNGPLFDIARLGGPFSLMLALCVGGAAIRVLFTALAARNTSGLDVGRRALLGSGLALSVVLVALSGAVAPSGGKVVKSESVAAVQGGGARGTSAKDVNPETVTKAQLDQVQRVPYDTALTVLPEDVVALSGSLEGSWQNAALRAEARRLSTTLLVGVTSPEGTTQFNNYVVAYSPTGSQLGTVEKVHRVPFGEYIPFRSFLSHFANISGVPRDAVVGTGNEVIDTPAGPLGVLISFEVFFSERSHDVVSHGAQLLVVPTNTTSYPTSQMPAQELAAAKLQAMETGRDLIQASPTGVSAIINHRGTVLAQSSLSTPTVLTGTVSLRSGLTLYDRWGDWPVLVISLAALALGQLRSRQRTQLS